MLHHWFNDLNREKHEALRTIGVLKLDEAHKFWNCVAQSVCLFNGTKCEE